MIVVLFAVFTLFTLFLLLKILKYTLFLLFKILKYFTTSFLCKSKVSIAKVDSDLPYSYYNVNFYPHNILTLLTSSPSKVDSWLSETCNRPSLPHRLIVGLDVEWRPNNRNMNNPVAILQLCVGPRCLIFQIRHSPNIPQSLIKFLSNTNHTFVGVGIEEDVEKLVCDYGLSVAKFADLRDLAFVKLGDRELKKAGIKTLARRVLDKEIEKPKSISRSEWDNMWLTPDQVNYACIDAFISFEVARVLYSRQL